MLKRFTAVAAAILMLGIVGCEEDDDNGPDEEFAAVMTGAAERPNPVTTNATGTATFDRNGDEFSYRIEVEDITGVTAAHIHGPATTEQPAGVLVTLFGGPQTGAVNGVLETGTFTATDNPTVVSMDSLLVLMRAGLTYVNVHTAANPPGEIRGQVETE